MLSPWLPSTPFQVPPNPGFLAILHRFLRLDLLYSDVPMAGRRKTPRLRFDGRCFVVDVYTPDDKRTAISFGPPGERTEGHIFSAFGAWLDLFIVGGKVDHSI